MIAVKSSSMVVAPSPSRGRLGWGWVICCVGNPSPPCPLLEGEAMPRSLVFRALLRAHARAVSPAHSRLSETPVPALKGRECLSSLTDAGILTGGQQPAQTSGSTFPESEICLQTGRRRCSVCEIHYFSVETPSISLLSITRRHLGPEYRETSNSLPS